VIQKLLRFVLISVCFIFAPQWGYAKILNPRLLTLPNGLTVYFVEDHRTPIVTLTVGYQVGSADVTHLPSGIAHYVEHMMFKGAPGLSENEFSQRIESLGGTSGAFTSFDRTCYEITLPKEHAATAFDFESRRMGNLTITDDQVAREKEVILEEISMHHSGNPYTKMNQEAAGQLLIRHTYRLPIGGDIQDVQSISRQDILDFHHHWYSPSNAIVIICGDLSEQEAFQLAKSYFEPIPSRGTPERYRPQEPDRPADLSSRIQASDPRIKLPILTQSMRLGSISPTDLKRTIALDLISNRLGAPGTGYLWLELVEHAKMAESVSVSVYSSLRDHVLAEISVTLAPGVSIEAMEAKIQQTLAAFLDQVTVELNDEQTNRLKKTAMSTLAYMHDNIHSTATTLATHLATGFPLSLFEEAPQTLATLRSGDLQKEARDWLTQPFPVTSLILPPKDPADSVGLGANPPKGVEYVMHHSRRVP
jgi:zinc protease